MGLNAGALDREITLQTATRTQNEDTGEELITWAEEDLWAEWLPGTSREAYFAAQRLSATLDGIFRIYYRTPVPTPDDYRIVFDGVTYDIKGVSEVRRKEGLEIAVVGSAEA